MKTIGCPAHIEFLLWVHTRCEPFPREDAPVFKELTAELVKCKVIEWCALRDTGEGLWAVTPLGRAWVKSLCNVPMPKAAYLDEMGRVL